MTPTVLPTVGAYGVAYGGTPAVGRRFPMEIPGLGIGGHARSKMRIEC